MQDIDLLETLEQETGPAPAWTVLWLHGLGADGHDFAPIVPELLQPGWPALRAPTGAPWLLLARCPGPPRAARPLPLEPVRAAQAVPGRLRTGRRAPSPGTPARA